MLLLLSRGGVVGFCCVFDVGVGVVVAVGGRVTGCWLMVGGWW